MLKMLVDQGKKGIEVSSAGVAAAIWMDSPKEVHEALAEEGVVDVKHTPRTLEEGMEGNPDLILAMEDHHKKFILEKFPEFQKKVFLLKEYAEIGPSPRGIADPIGKNKDVYRQILVEIKSCLLKIIPKL